MKIKAILYPIFNFWLNINFFCFSYVSNELDNICLNIVKNYFGLKYSEHNLKITAPIPPRFLTVLV